MATNPVGPVILWARGEDGKYTPFSGATINDVIQNLGKAGPVDGFVITGEPIELAPKGKARAKGKKTPPAAPGSPPAAKK